ncbi:MAG TPA: Asp-tRNA(Asn)/Glu-tRNA(Gln) amidotransferase subunit GatC [Gemmatimonadaceae bacterium]|nr:Asp-tRNA(Asn)/Glu-tRNA(Gln) amidotransferase subunit GatC [Gemmatimonadaceae bacterium]
MDPGAKAAAAAVTVDDVRHVAMLARLGVSDERARALTRDLNAILEHMAVLARVDTTGIDETAAKADGGMRLRDESAPCVQLASKPEAFAPEMRHGFFIVPRLSSHEDVSA